MMDTTSIKNYAPKARRDFIEAVTRRAAKYGITEKKIVGVEEQGELYLIGGEAFGKRETAQRRKLEERIQREGFHHVMESIAYTWFNRLAAIRYMELHGYLDHSYRMLSPSPHGEDDSMDGGGRVKQEARTGGRGEGTLPEILEHAEHVDLPGLDKNRVIELKLAGTKDEELYRELLLAQCHALHLAMPFLFETIDDETELLLPDNLTHTHSLIRELVTAIPEADWQNVEIIGWLYQFYISEKKKQVIGKVVKSEDIPAATQLFTPNWIVKYMVQNSLGAQWLATYPQSSLKSQMDYYIEPAEQTDEVKAQLAAITPDSLDPEALTLIDPASGSGHILVEAYELFKAIYLERGYRQRDVSRLILEKNLFGLDIDERAAQLTGFALMMKGRADDRRLFEHGVKLNVMALVDSTDFDAERLADGINLADHGLQPGDLTELKRLFEHATTFGSLIQVPEGLAEKLPALRELSEWKTPKEVTQDWTIASALKLLRPLVWQAEVLATQYDAVVANPPYMGNGGMNAPLKKFAKDNFPESKGDLFACFIERGFQLAQFGGINAMITMQSWMFLSGYQMMREILLHWKTIQTMAHLGARAFGSISGEVVQTTVSVFKNRPLPGYRPVFFRLLTGGEEDKRSALGNREQRFDTARQADFERIPGSPIAYWVSESIAMSFSDFPALEAVGETLQGMTTCDNDFYIRWWWEVEHDRIRVGSSSREEAKASGRKWFPYTKGGAYRKWAGNSDLIVNWEDDGALLRSRRHPREDKVWAHNFNLDHIFREGGSYSSLSSGTLALRYTPAGNLFDQKGSMVFANATDLRGLLALMNSRLAMCWLEALCPTLDFNPGALLKIPVDPKVSADARILGNVDIAVTTATADWNACDTGMDFQSLPLLTTSSDPTPILESSYTTWITQNRDTIAEMKRLEEENNRLFIDAYGLQEELESDVPIEQITLTVNPAYRYGSKLSEEEQWTRFREDTMAELISYAIGCMMGRYSLDAPGLIYAHSGNEGFDSSRYTSFPADTDGIVPLTDSEWFDDDATNRFRDFLSIAWDAGHLDENLRFVADNLKPKRGESPLETIRRYFSTKFFKDHLKTYKKRPIYWLFSSGKQKAFEALVYLHRYNEGTLSRMRMEYVVPLQSRIHARIDQLDGDIATASSTANRNKLQKEKDNLVKQREELSRFDEKLRHHADQRISLDLDGGVKVNYGKFGDLLAEVKAVTGNAPQNR